MCFPGVTSWFLLFENKKKKNLFLYQRIPEVYLYVHIFSFNQNDLRLLQCVCVFIKLHITAQSGPDILSHFMPLALIFQGDINNTYYENLSSDATNVCVCVCVCVFSSHSF